MLLALAALIAAGGADAPPRFSSSVDVVARPRLTVAEVLARHRQAAARQAERIPRWVATGHATIVFQAPGLAAPMTVTARATVFTAPGVHETELADLRLNGVPVPVTADAIPRLPLVEPEPVAIAPLAPEGDAAYRYRLLDPEAIDGVPCHVVAFAPTAGGPLDRGRAWIAEDDFGLVRYDAARTGLRGPIVASRRIDDYARRDVAGEAAWVLRRSAFQQAYEAPGHRTPIDRVLDLRTHEADPAGFDARRRAVHASRAVVVAETRAGLQYLRRGDSETADPAPLRHAGGRATRIWTVAAGVLADPGIDGVLPYAGIGYLDLDLLGTGTQLNAFAAGPFLQLAWSGRARGALLQARAFASLVEYNDRSFRDGVERYDENVRQRPASAALEAVTPAGRWRLRAAYEFARPGLRAGPDTGDAFVAPASPLVHGLRLGLETEAARWTVSAWAAASRRSAWHEWGRAGDPDSRPSARDYEKAGLSVARAFVVSPRVVARLDVAAMAGRDLDRFSRFTFDGLENRLHGSPAASVRFDRGVVARSALSAGLGRGFRADAFLDGALVRDPSSSDGARAFPGLGAALQAPLPKATTLSLEWGYGPRARNGQGAHVWRLTAYKVL